MTSILKKIKQLVGVQAEETHFDADIMVHINSAIMALAQIGLSTAEGFMVVDDSATWDELVPVTNKALQGACQSFIYLKTKLVFDPPNHSFVITALQDSLKETEWRLSIELDKLNESSDTEQNRR